MGADPNDAPPLTRTPAPDEWASAKAQFRAGHLQLARGWVHPALGTRPLKLAPGAAWIGSPAEGYTLIWRAHWSDEQVPVLLILTSNNAAPHENNARPAGPRTGPNLRDMAPSVGM